MIVGGVLGSPISHSLSPLLHKTMYEFLGIEATYSAFEVQSGGLNNFLQNDGAALNNISLTMPLKEEALSVADSVSEISRQIQSGNTMFKRNDVWNLTSTDVEGFTYALQSHSRSAQGNVLIIGAGATARAVVAACHGVSQQVTVAHRNPGREIAIRRSGLDLSINFIPWASDIDFADYDLVVNTSPGDAASVFIDQISRVGSTFFEVLYNPWPTKILTKWRDSGGYGIDGLDLLIHQAISQVEIFASRTLDRDEVARMLRVVGERALI